MKKEKFYKVQFNKDGGRAYSFSERDFFRRFEKPILAAEERFNEQTEAGKNYVKGVLSGRIADDLESPFWDDFLGNFNRYCDTWTSPRGVEPIYQIEIERTFGGKK